MALVPQGAVLEATEEVKWPTVRIGNTWVMPGVPEVFLMKVPVIVARIGHGPSFVSRAVFTKMEEGDLKPLLDRVVAAFPDVDVGSYPKWMEATYRTKLTFVATLPAGEPQWME
jgi:molybdopterin-biosynthesis enzyme MoeA-like protein